MEINVHKSQVCGGLILMLYVNHRLRRMGVEGSVVHTSQM